ncbi:MAG: hypothetical protein HRU15_05510, partial [Planctomycetes bacterium]|nr:hypothetical protein [Planctomycetota bacterium]
TSTPVAINSLLAKIDARSDSAAPRPLPPIDYTAAISRRLGAKVETEQTMQWLFSHPDIIIGNVEASHVYTAYEVFAPEISVTDEVGSITINVSTPRMQGGSARGIENDSVWVENERTTADGELVQNSASWLGVRIEYKVGKGDWTPLSTPGMTKGGYYIFKDEDFTIPDSILAGVQGEQRFEFRCQLLVKGTGVIETGAALIGNEVIMWDGKCPRADRPGWKRIAGRVKGRLLPLAADVIPAGVKLSKNENAYLGSVSELAIIEKTEADVVIALKSVSALPGQPTTARIMMRKKVRNALGTVLGWTEAVEVKAVEVKGKVGYPKTVKRDFDPNKIVCEIVGAGPREVDFRTEWTVKEVKMDAVRTVYYEVKKVRTPEGATSLVLRPKMYPSYQLVIIENSNGDTVALPKLKSLSISANILPFIFPQLPNKDAKFNEIKAFEGGDPQDFLNPIMLPEEPVSHPASDLVNYDPQAATNIPFYVFADDRYVYYDHLAKKLKAAEIERPEVKEPGPEVDPNAEGGEVDAEAAARAQEEAERNP